MRFIAIEYNIPDTSNRMKGYLRAPDDISTAWIDGFFKYLRDEKKVESSIKFYPINIHFDSNNMGKTITGYTNIEDLFMEALTSTKYYPNCAENDAIRRAFANLHLTGGPADHTIA